MATRSRTTFNKRQKEAARMEKSRDKQAKRLQRKSEKKPDGSPDDFELSPRDDEDLDLPAFSSADPMLRQPQE
ncbi:MAG: hypothetical protein ABI823_13530 [Bryobacteraceae bacterium]